MDAAAVEELHKEISKAKATSKKKETEEKKPKINETNEIKETKASIIIPCDHSACDHLSKHFLLRHSRSHCVF